LYQLTGDVLDIVGEINNAWLHAIDCNGVEGMIPANRVVRQ
jgi:hypothetical protein